MEPMDVLRRFSRIDKLIETERLAIQLGKEYAMEFYNTLHSTTCGDQVQGSPLGEVMASAMEQLGDYATKERARMRAAEWNHLMEYRSLMELKLFSIKALQSLPDQDAAILQERALEYHSWMDIAAAHNYSESQTRRHFEKALENFGIVYNQLLLGKYRYWEKAAEDDRKPAEIDG